MILARARKQAGKFPKEVTDRDRASHRPHVAALVTIDGDGEGLRRRCVLRAQSAIASADRRHRRRFPLRRTMRSTDSASAHRLHFAPRHSDATQALNGSARSSRKSFLHGVRDGNFGRRRHRQVPVLSRGDALACAAHLHAGLTWPRPRSAPREAKGIAAASRRSLRVVSCVEGARARGAITLTASRWSSTSTSPARSRGSPGQATTRTS